MNIEMGRWSLGALGGRHRFDPKFLLSPIEKARPLRVRASDKRLEKA
jgi:hypothetical protein